MFEKASRMKLRFVTAKGSLTVEDLWSLPLTNKTGLSLDGVAKSVNRKLKEAQEESFVTSKTKINEEAELALAIVKRVIQVRLAEVAEKEAYLVRQAKRKKIMGILEEKEYDSLKSLDRAELEKLLDY